MKCCPKLLLVLPFYNEEKFLGRTLESLRNQSRQDFILHLVDNASTDASAVIAREFADSMPAGQVVLLHEDEPGKTRALRTGLSSAITELVGTLDADTIYPSDYVSKTIDLFAANCDAAAVLAVGVPDPARDASTLALARIKSALFPGKCQSGGFGQTFRRADLEAVGGFDHEIWPFILEDHEIMVRVGQRGRIVHGWDHVCFPSDRRSPGQPMGWTLSERLIYQLIPVFALNWYFHSVLAKRFKRRKLGGLKLRDRPWEDGAA